MMAVSVPLSQENVMSCRKKGVDGGAGSEGTICARPQQCDCDCDAESSGDGCLSETTHTTTSTHSKSPWTTETPIDSRLSWEGCSISSASRND